MKKNFFVLIISITLGIQGFAITWSSPITISGTDANGVGIATNVNGDAVAVWTQFDGVNTILWGASYTGSWSSAANISNSSVNAAQPEIAFSDAGNAVVVWISYDGSNFSIQASVFSGGTWSSPVQISVSGYNAFNARVAVNSSGDAIAIWSQQTANHQVIQTSLYSGGSWGGSQTISSIGQESSIADIAFSDTGDALAVWASYDDLNSIYVIQAASYTSSTWGSPVTISDTTYDHFYPRVVINSTGLGIAAWSTYNVQNEAYANVYSSGAWGTSQLISSSSINADFIRIAINDNGNAVAIWLSQSNSSQTAYGGAIYSSGAWGSSQTASLNDIIVPIPSSIGIDGNNNVIALWLVQAFSITIVHSAEFSSGLWGNSIAISLAEEVFYPKIAVSSNGDTFAAWGAFNGTNYVINASVGVP